MIIFLSILIGLFTILLLVTLHELGHFIVAKLSGAYIYEFSIGMGPKIFQWGKKETRYTLRLLPLGGYVSIASEIVDPPKGRENEKIEDKQLMENLHRGKKALFISAGALMNLFLAFILLIVGYAIFPYKNDFSMAPTFANYGPIHEEVLKYNEDDKHEIKINDGAYITFIRDTNPDLFPEASIKNYYQLNAWIESWKIKFIKAKEETKDLEPKIEVTLINDSQENEFKINPKLDVSDNYFFGVSVSSRPLSAGQVVGDGFVDTFKNSYSVLLALGKLVTFQWGQLSGPVGIIKSTSSFLDSSLSVQESFSTFFRWASLLSANLFLLNMIPIPPLDGYKFVENAVEAVTRKKINPKFKIIISVIGAILFLLIFIAITIKDILV